MFPSEFEDENKDAVDVTPEKHGGSKAGEPIVDDVLNRIGCKRCEELETQLRLTSDEMTATSATVLAFEESVLGEAHSIVNGERASDYGPVHESFTKVSSMLELLLDESEWASIIEDKKIKPRVIVKMLVALKLTRESYKSKRDNLVDACGYLHILDQL